MWGEDTGIFVSAVQDARFGAAVRAGFRSRGRKHWVFAHEDAQVGVLAQLRGLATRGSAPSAALGRLEDGAPASRDRLRCTLVAQGLLPRKLPRHTNPSANS